MKNIFVFGSNLAGRHGAGAAKEAREKWGAKYGVGVGLTGNAYALPTKDEKLRSLKLEEIKSHIDTFIAFAKDQPEMLFLVTPVGTGLAENDIHHIANCFNRGDLPNNLVFTMHWFNKGDWWNE